MNWQHHTAWSGAAGPSDVHDTYADYTFGYPYVPTSANLYVLGSATDVTSPFTIDWSTYTAPDAPVITTTMPGDHSATITWLKPASTIPILGYAVTASPGGQSCSTDSADALSCTITGLTNGVDYTFTVTARNAAGTSPPPTTPPAPVTIGTPPSPVTGITPVRDSGGSSDGGSGDGTQVTLTWLAAASDPSLPIIGYEATAEPGGNSCSTTGALSCTITGLDPTVDYSFTVVAINAVGTSPPGPPVVLPADATPPEVTGTPDRAPNAAGWYSGPVTVHWTAADPDNASTALALPPDTVLSADGASQVITSGQACDPAGNCATGSATLYIDSVAPVIAATVTPATPDGSNGWYRTHPTITFTCSDALSGVASCPAPVTVQDGASQSVSGTAADNAGNTASASVTGLKVDTTPPTLSITGVTEGSKYVTGTPLAPACTASDALSGLAAPCHLAVTGGNANGVGAFTATATATDLAGNTATAAVRYKVIYGWAGFSQPINDTAHNVGESLSVFKAGSTVPAQFTLVNAAGQVIQPLSAPEWITPDQGVATTLPVDETVYSTPADSGSQYRQAGSMWQYNWKTAKSQAGYYWRIGVTLDDGETYYVNIALR